MGGTCFDCTKPAGRACTHCGRFFCPDHGVVGKLTDVPVCTACLAGQKRIWLVALGVAGAGAGAWLLYNAVR